MRKFFYLQLLIIAGLFSSFESKAQIEDFKVGSTTRKMLVYAPSDILPDRPLLISMHGMNQDINYQQNQTKWELVAKENNFVVVYPAGINNAWDMSGNRDIDFILAIIDEMVNRYNIDRNRVYLSGFSMGGMMTYIAATKIADKIAAFAPVGGYLMGGPNTNSSRPVPIIHTHGTTDDVVPFSGVQRSLDAWIARNNCPTEAVITKPYPEGTKSNGTRYYWGPGTDSVEVVLLSLNGVGHWHFNDPSGLHTSNEIWKFCKKFALGFGVPKFITASVYDANPNQIQVRFSKPLKSITKIEGFSVKVDGVEAEIDTVLFIDSLHLAVNLSNNLTNTDEIELSYNNGNVLSVYDKALLSFSDTLVNNQLYGSSPKLVDLVVNESGDTLIARFNKKMLLPSNISELELKAEFNGQKNIPIAEFLFFKNDSTVLAFVLEDTVYADYDLSLSYTGNTIVSSDSGLFKNDTAYLVVNKAKGLPVKLISGVLYESAMALTLEFSKAMAMKDNQIEQITVKINSKNVAIKEVFNLKNSIRINLFSNIYHGDTIIVSYIPGTITAADKGALEAFTDFEVENPLPSPTYAQVPGKVEAENYTLQFGIATENTNDTGGGLNVGWTETGDWLVYAIENNSDETVYQINFRLAAQSSGPKFDYYIDDVKIGQIVVPTTGAWQKFQSVVKDITVPKGKHYFKIVTVTGGFNINYFEIQKLFVGVNQLNSDKVMAYSNPTSKSIIIKSEGFQYDKIEILDISGRTVYTNHVRFQPELELSVNLNSGVYLVRISNNNSFYTSKINISK